MELRYTNEQEGMRLAVRKFAEEEISPRVKYMESTCEFPHEIVEQMARKGLMGIPISSQWGGAGADFISYILAIEEISKVSAAVGVILSVHTSVGTIPILQYGTDEQREKYVRKLAQGESLGAFALTEAHAGSDAASIRTTAEYNGDHYVLNGAKMFITNAGVADTYVMFAVTNPGQGTKGISAFIIEKGMPGLQVGLNEKKMGLHGSHTCELIIDGLKVPINQRLGDEDQGFLIALGSLDGGRIGIAAQALGIAEAALQAVEAVDSRYRRPTANAPDSFQFGLTHTSYTRSRLDELRCQLEAARLLVYKAAYMRQKGLVCTKEASMAKMYASDTAVAVTNEVIRLLGPMGSLKGLPFERLFRDAKVTQIYEGTNEIHRIVIGNQLLRD